MGIQILFTEHRISEYFTGMRFNSRRVVDGKDKDEQHHKKQPKLKIYFKQCLDEIK